MYVIHVEFYYETQYSRSDCIFQNDRRNGLHINNPLPTNRKPVFEHGIGKYTYLIID